MPKTFKEEINKEVKHTAEHIGIISKGCLQTLVDRTRKEEREEIMKWAERETNLRTILGRKIVGYQKGHNDGVKSFSKALISYLKQTKGRRVIN